MARDYSIFRHTFWTGETGRKLRDAGPDAQRVAAYLITCGSSNMIGLYYLPLPLLCHELRLTKQGALEALQRVRKTGFGAFEGVEEVVFVPEMAAQQIGPTLTTKDNRHKSVVRAWEDMRKSRFYMDFYRRYGECFHLPEPSPLQAPCKPLRSQEQEQEQEQDIHPQTPKGALSAGADGVGSSNPPKRKRTRAGKPVIPYTPEFEDWWLQYPAHRRDAKGATFNAYNAAIPRVVANHAGLDYPQARAYLRQKTIEFAQSPAGNDAQFTPMPATWLNQDRFEADSSAWQHKHADAARPSMFKDQEGEYPDL